MKYLASLFLIFAFIKNIFYGFYEINQNKNKSGGIVVIFLSFLGLTLPMLILFILY
jgi:hypothetical protein